MSSILLSNEIIIFLFVQIILFILLSIAFYFSLSIIKNWDFNKTTNKQYKLEKTSYLVILIISFTLIVKIVLFPYFAYTLDNLSNIVPGAMCAAGIVGANEFGQINLTLKILILFFIGVWLIINSLDLKEKTYPFTKKKYFLYIFIFILSIIELFLDFSFLENISTKEPVMCCSVIFGVNNTGSKIPFDLSISNLLIVFYLLYILTTILSLQKSSFLNLIINFMFLYIGYYAVTYFFSTYIYQLPTHQCPFCMLQREYYFIGYFIWGTLFLGTFFGVSSFILKNFINKDLAYTYKYSLIFNTLFVFLCSFYVIRYYLVNGVFL
ncbi:hypothetical protein [Arcobacter ellisii]|uniref:Membrane protein n=1 Tax=Arcobacter ellisii TaxID=913109 RepID=A0A347UBJ7_9BACT|nr:hypothetical protein [Arcobacter ellisii]AXX96225.1 putative membrane protein [Arcobacter ellisii]RXI31928.1 hypothetical protein CP962_03885 [Arcobacter ellisii]